MHTTHTTIPEELQHNRLEIQTRNISLKQKWKIHDHPKKTRQQKNKGSCKKSLRQKMRNLQQMLRRSKQNVDSMNEVIKVMQEKLVINSNEAETLRSESHNI